MSSITTGQPFKWSEITPDPITFEKIQLLTHPDQALNAQGYLDRELDEQHLWAKARCLRCHAKLQTKQRPSTIASADTQGTVRFSPYNGTSSQHVSQQGGDKRPQAKLRSSDGRYQCMFHAGKFSYGNWTCCGGRGNTKGCSSSIDHWLPSEAGLRNMLRCCVSPAAKESTALSAAITPTSKSLPSSIRKAVVLDCEMGQAMTGDPELIRVTLIDLFQPLPPLIDKLVKPDVEMLHLNTKYSGVSYSMLNNAVRTRQCLFGRDATRRKVFEYVDANTIVFVHGGTGDFTCLRWMHPRKNIIDTCLLEETHGTGQDAAVDENGELIKQKRSLKELAAKKCGLAVQTAGKKGHDSLEDTLATRELVAWWLAFIQGSDEA